MASILHACYTQPKPLPDQAVTGAYILDPAHTSIVLRIKHAGLSNYTARFDTVSGVLDFDAKRPERSKVDILIDPASLSTGDHEFDTEIATSSKYFNAKKFPGIRFVSRQILITGQATGQIVGDLTFRGQTRPITLDTVFNGSGKSFGHKGKTLGFSATAKFKRSDFGLTHLIAFGIGDTISLAIETEFNQK